LSNEEEKKAKLREIADIYKSKANDLQKVFIIIVGLGLFFFFMILFPYFSLKYDSMTLSNVEWLTGKIPQIINPIDSINNESQTVTNNLQIYANARNRYDLEVTNYNNQINKLVYLTQNLSVPLDSPVLQNLLQNVDIFSKCIKYTFGTEIWRKCNTDTKLNSTRTPLMYVFNNQYNLINMSKGKIEKTIVDTTALITSLDKQVENQKTTKDNGNIIENYHNISKNTLSVFSIVTNNLKSIELQSVLYADPQFRVVSLTQLKHDLEQLVNNIEKRRSDIETSMKGLANRFDQFESPIGKIPLRINEVIAMFPMLLAIGFLVFSFLLTQVMRLRIELKNKYQSEDPFGITKVDHFISFLGPLWIDPLAAKNEQRLRLTVLFAPFVLLFLVCLYMVIAIMFYLDNPFTTSDDLFSAATMINGYIFIVIDILGLAVVVYSYSRTALFIERH